LIAVLLFLGHGCYSENASVPSRNVVGWNVLSSDKHNANAVIEKTDRDGVNHLQLSHEIIHDLKEINNLETHRLVNELSETAHKRGIPEVVVWDHALYNLEYYPAEFKTAKEGKINLDNPKFWE
jgi:hypothetical protein